MASKSAIEWTDATWNPIRAAAPDRWACEKVSPGCDYCYAERFNRRLGGHAYDGKTPPVLDEVALHEPLRWQRPRKVFVCSMTDLFWDQVPDAWIERILAVALLAPRHIFQVCTKRPERMAFLLGGSGARSFRELVYGAATHLHDQRGGSGCGTAPIDGLIWPPRNLWLGTTVENQGQAMRRLPWLARTPAAVRFVSIEPMLGAVDLSPWLGTFPIDPAPPFFHWVITGGESGGPPDRAMVHKPPHGNWGPFTASIRNVRRLRDQCRDAGVAFFHKQWGGPQPTSAGAELDGEIWHQFPGMRYPEGVTRTPAWLAGEPGPAVDQLALDGARVAVR